MFNPKSNIPSPFLLVSFVTVQWSSIRLGYVHSISSDMSVNSHKIDTYSCANHPWIFYVFYNKNSCGDLRDRLQAAFEGHYL